MARPRRGPTSADAVIIGAGISGLTAAALLSHRGLRVVVIERDIHPGGCAAGFSRDGYRFAVGATVAMGFEPGGILRDLYRHLRIEPRFVPVSPAMRVHLPDRKVSVETDPAAWLAEVQAVFPGQDRAKRAFWERIARLAGIMYRLGTRFPVLPFRHHLDVLDTVRAIRPEVLPVLPQLRRTIADMLADHAIEDPAHRAFIDGQLLDAVQTSAEHCIAPNGALALGIYRHGCQYKIGGLETIARDLAGFLETRGGEVHYATRANAILRQGGRVAGVGTSRGEVHAPVVISAVPLENTAELLQNPTGSDLVRRAARQPEMWGAFTLYLGVDERCLPDDVHTFEQITDFGLHEDGGNILVSVSPSWDRSRAPEGKRAITASTHVSASEWLALAADRERYAASKRRLEQRMLGQIERALPGLGAGIEVLLSGSPRTFRNFTLRAGGRVGGIPQTAAAANFAAPSHRTETAGLFLAGDTVFPGQGTLGVSVSGFNAARSAFRYLRATPAAVAATPKEVVS